jgi:glycosyltransferase involved in cell wall biosynthesis
MGSGKIHTEKHLKMREPVQGRGGSNSVLIVDLSKRYGGADVRVFDVARALHGHPGCGVATLKGSPLHRRLEEAGLTAVPFDISRGSPAMLFALWRRISRFGYHVVDAHNPQSQLWGLLAARLAGVDRRVSTVHSSYGATEKGVKKRLYESVLALNYRWGCHFVAVSESVSEYLHDLGIPPARISLIHNGIHIDDVHSTRIGSPLAVSPGWGEDSFVVIVVGRLEPVKGHAYLIDALHLLARDHPEIRCLVVGEGRTRKVLESRVDRYGLGKTVHFTGFREDIGWLLRQSQVFCLPSLSEGLPYALLEACAARLPLLVTEVGGVAKLFRHGETALFVPPADPEAIARSLSFLAENAEERRRLGNAAFQFVRDRLSPERMIEQTLNVYGGKY